MQLGPSRGGPAAAAGRAGAASRPRRSRLLLEAPPASPSPRAACRRRRASCRGSSVCARGSRAGGWSAEEEYGEWEQYDDDGGFSRKAPRGGRNKKKRPRKGRVEEEEEGEPDGGGLSTADLDVHLDVIYQGLGEPLDSSGKDMWLHAAGYNAAVTRSVPMGPLNIRPVPPGVEVAFNAGVLEWSNAVMLPVNLGGSKSRRGNQLLEGGSKITWLPSPRHLGDNALMSRLLAPSGDLGGDIHAPGERAPVLLYCRAGKKLPYVFCGELGCVEASLVGSVGLQQEDAEGMQEQHQEEERQEEQHQEEEQEEEEHQEEHQEEHAQTDPLLVFELLDYDELVGGSKHFRNLIEFWEVGI